MLHTGNEVAWGGCVKRWKDLRVFSHYQHPAIVMSSAHGKAMFQILPFYQKRAYSCNIK